MAKFVILVIVSTAACVSTPDDENAARRQRDAAVDSPPTTYPDPSIPGVIACFTEGAPDKTCEPGVGCLFDNYSAMHNGYCTTTDIPTYGWETCDGPEDCATGEYCCQVNSRDEYDMPHVNIGCSATACSAAPVGYELCHAGSTAAGTCSNPSSSCVATRDAGNYAIAQNLYVCN